MVVVLLHAPAHQESFPMLQRMPKPSVFRPGTADFKYHWGADREGEYCSWGMPSLEEVFVVGMPREAILRGSVPRDIHRVKRAKVETAWRELTADQVREGTEPRLKNAWRNRDVAAIGVAALTRRHNLPQGAPSIGLLS